MRQVLPDDAGPDYDPRRVIERSGAFYWISSDGTREYGPFATLLEAVQDMKAPDEDDAPEPGETLQEAEAEMGIADWVDPETGELAEQDTTRLEEH